MGPEAFRAYFRLGMWVTLVALVLVLVLPRDGPEFIISICSLAVGLTLMTLIFVAGRLLR
jgi:hypothetical protein